MQSWVLNGLAVAIAATALSLTAPAEAKQGAVTAAQQRCLNGFNSCRSPCFGKRNPGPCLASCQAKYKMCRRQAD